MTKRLPPISIVTPSYNQAESAEYLVAAYDQQEPGPDREQLPKRSKRLGETVVDIVQEVLLVYSWTAFTERRPDGSTAQMGQSGLFHQV